MLYWNNYLMGPTNATVTCPHYSWKCADVFSISHLGNLYMISKCQGKLYNIHQKVFFSFWLTYYWHIYIYIPFWCKNFTNNSFEFSWYISYRYHTNFLDIHPQTCLLPIFIFVVFQSILWLKTLTQDLYWTLNTTLRYNLNSHPNFLLYQVKAHL